MAEIRPFRGLRYNQSIIEDLSVVICPPYDVISPSFHEELNARSEYNFIRLEDARRSFKDTANNNKYTRSEATLNSWRVQNILVTEPSPAIYLHDHYFHLQGRAHMRRGITVRVRLEEWDKMVVRPHEDILSTHKEDRQNLLRALRVNTSPILMMYHDPERKIASILSAQSKKEPIIDTGVPEGDKHEIWTITDPGAIEQISGLIAGQPLYVADGHHRYTSALAYKNEQIAGNYYASPDASFNFVMATLVDFADPGLIVLAPHRMVSGLLKSVLKGLEEKLKESFEITTLPKSPDIWHKLDTILARTDGLRMGMFVHGRDEFCVLKLKDTGALEPSMFPDHSDIYRKLDVSILDHLILKKILGLTIGSSDEKRLSFTHDRDDAVKQVAKGEQQAVFLLRPVNPELIKAIADAKDKMPRKSTYFYPKAPAGLIVNPLF
ncbi:MAG: DUF1015 domain-containing protein [Dehalococcoidales bacterium]|nr:DUF1015 domain-containing protein [Dehalococcoidales bacterium]